MLVLQGAGQAHAADAAAAGSQLGARSGPGWLRDGVIYEIFPRDFSAAGTLAGVTAQLDRLQHLGVDVLWLMPIHSIGTLHRKGTFGSPYAVRDYRAINGDYGADADLHTLISEAHKRGLHVVIDIVANQHARRSCQPCPWRRGITVSTQNNCDQYV